MKTSDLKKLIDRVLLAASFATSALACEDQSCTAEARLYPIQVQRDLAVPFADIESIAFEACTPARCQTLRAVGGAFNDGALDAVLGGNVTKREDGSTHFAGIVYLVEGAASSSTHVTVKATDAAGTNVLDVKGDVRWEAEECHPKPLDSSL